MKEIVNFTICVVSRFNYRCIIYARYSSSLLGNSHCHKCKSSLPLLDPSRFVGVCSVPIDSIACLHVVVLHCAWHLLVAGFSSIASMLGEVVTTAISIRFAKLCILWFAYRAVKYVPLPHTLLLHFVAW